eukprot:144439-Rhodomonas_salina.1
MTRSSNLNILLQSLPGKAGPPLELEIIASSITAHLRPPPKKCTETLGSHPLISKSRDQSSARPLTGSMPSITSRLITGKNATVKTPPKLTKHESQNIKRQLIKFFKSQHIKVNVSDIELSK